MFPYCRLTTKFERDERMNASETTRCCTKCGLRQPIENFVYRNRSRGVRHRWCRACSTTNRREAYQRARHKDLRRFVQRLGNIPRDEQAVVALARHTLDRFGGVGGLSRELRETVDQARAAGKHDVALRTLLAIINLATAAERLEAGHMRSS